MHEVALSTGLFPTVTFAIAGVEGDTTGLKRKKGSGEVVLEGYLTIRSTTHDVSIPATYTWEGDTLKLVGAHQIKWPEYDVPDPSIVVSTLYPELDFRFDVSLKAAN